MNALQRYKPYASMFTNDQSELRPQSSFVHSGVKLWVAGFQQRHGLIGPVRISWQRNEKRLALPRRKPGNEGRYVWLRLAPVERRDEEAIAGRGVPFSACAAHDQVMGNTRNPTVLDRRSTMQRVLMAQRHHQLAHGNRHCARELPRTSPWKASDEVGAATAATHHRVQEGGTRAV